MHVSIPIVFILSLLITKTNLQLNFQKRIMLIILLLTFIYYFN